MTLTRYLSPGSILGDAFRTARLRWDLMCWRPQTEAEMGFKCAVARVAPRYTMVGLPRLRRLIEHARLIHHDRVPGAVVECGTWRGGDLALIDFVFRSLGDARELWAFDSFEGLPRPGARDPRSAHRWYFHGWCAATEDDVRRASAILGGDPSRVRVVKGWLNETVPAAETGPIALLNVDVDWYASVQCVLESFYDRVIPGGVINFDDYGCWSGCDNAVHDFLDERGLPKHVLQRSAARGAWLRRGH